MGELSDKLNSLPINGSPYELDSYVFLYGRFDLIKHDISVPGISSLSELGIWSISRREKQKYEIVNGYARGLPGVDAREVVQFTFDIEAPWDGDGAAVANIRNMQNKMKLYGEIVGLRYTPKDYD